MPGGKWPEVCPEGFTTENLPASVLPARRPAPQGPGTELKAILAAIGITEATGCGCADMAAKMNAWGPDECEARLPEIIAYLLEQAEKRSWSKLVPFKSAAVEVLVRQAIDQARAKLNNL